MPDIKYHYTSVDAMASIFKRKQLRMTRSEFLNDPTDCKVLFSLIEKYLTYKSADITAMLTNPDLRRVYETAPLKDYIAFLQKHIHLYVLSLTANDDQLPMWNYYGSGGIQLSIDIEQLIDILPQQLSSSNQYYAYSNVKYISETDTVDTISFEPFSSFRLDSKSRKNIFKENSVTLGRNGMPHPLYQTTTLKGFIDTYITGYIKSLEYLLSAPIRRITVTSTAEEIFKAVYGNTNTLDHYYEFKKDLTLYMIVLSALIKNDTYSFEKEFRVVYFENTLSPTVKAEYDVAFLQGQKYLRPYVATENLNMEFVKEIALSPLTRNLRIETELYTEIVTAFARETLGHPVNVTWSKHKIR